MVGGKKKKSSTKPKEEIVRIELRLPKSLVGSVKECQIIKQIEGSLQDAIQTILMQEVTRANLVEHDRELLFLLSNIKTTEELLDVLYNIFIKDGMKSECNLVTIRNTCDWLLENRRKGRCVYSAIDLADPVYCQKYGLPYMKPSPRLTHI